MRVLRIVGEVYERIANGSLSASAVEATLQDLIEHKPFGQSSLSTKVIAICEGVEITEVFLAQTMVRDGQRCKRHRNGGGWVPVEQDEYDESKPFVAETAYVGPYAQVLDRGRVYGNAELSGYARVFDDGQVRDNAELRDSRVSSGAQVFDRARLLRGALATGTVQIGGDTVLDSRHSVSSGRIME